MPVVLRMFLLNCSRKYLEKANSLRGTYGLSTWRRNSWEKHHASSPPPHPPFNVGCRLGGPAHRQQHRRTATSTCWLSAWRSSAQAAASKNSHLNIEWGGWGGGSSRHGRKNCATTFFIGLTAKKKRVFLFKKKVTDKTKRHRFS